MGAPLEFSCTRASQSTHQHPYYGDLDIEHDNFTKKPYGFALLTYISGLYMASAASGRSIDTSAAVLSPLCLRQIVGWATTLSILLLIYIYIYIYIYLFIYLLIYLSIYLFMCIYIYIYISCITLRTLDYGNYGMFLDGVMQDLYHQPYFSSAAAASVIGPMSCMHCCSI